MFLCRKGFTKFPEFFPRSTGHSVKQDMAKRTGPQPDFSSGVPVPIPPETLAGMPKATSPRNIHASMPQIDAMAA